MSTSASSSTRTLRVDTSLDGTDTNSIVPYTGGSHEVPKPQMRNGNGKDHSKPKELKSASAVPKKVDSSTISLKSGKSLESDRHVRIQIVADDGNSVTYSLKKTTAWRKLTNHYYTRRNIPRNTLRFLFDGKRIEARDTAISLGLQDDDVVEAYHFQSGGSGYEQE